jgi:hypothetical protein
VTAVDRSPPWRVARCGTALGHARRVLILSMQTRCVEVDEGALRQAKSLDRIDEGRHRSAWLLHFAAALPIRSARQLDKSTVLVVEVRRHQLGVTDCLLAEWLVSGNNPREGYGGTRCAGTVRAIYLCDKDE